MSKKLIILMLALPLILMLCLFTATSTVSLTISVPVERIEIEGENLVELDFDIKETHKRGFMVYPAAAANKKATFSTEAFGSEPLAELEYELEYHVDGFSYLTVTPKTCGAARVTLTTVDGGFRDSFVVRVKTNSLYAIPSTISDEVIGIGETATISTSYEPVNTPASHKALKYEVSEESVGIVNVNTQGVVRGLSAGVATIRVVSMINEAIYDEVQIEVKNSAAMQFTQKTITNTVKQSGGSIGLFIDESVEVTPSIQVLDADGNETASIISYELDKANKKLKYTFLNQDFEGRVTVRLTIRVEGLEPYIDECTITRIREIEASWAENNPSPIVKVGATAIFKFTCEPEDIELDYELALSNDLITVNVDMAQKSLTIVGNKVLEDAPEDSYTEITLTLTDKNNPDSKVTITTVIAVY